jgi:hypothetical protein
MHDPENPRLEELRAEIAGRLEPVCRDWPTEMFDEMVRGLAALTLKYEHSAAPGAYDRRTTDRLIDEMKALAQRNAEVRSTIEAGEAPQKSE